MNEFLKIDCGLQVVPTEEHGVDIASAGTTRSGQPKTEKGYVIFAQCPHPEADDLLVNLQVPAGIDLSRVSYAEAARVIISGDVYTCNKRGTRACPLSAKNK